MAGRRNTLSAAASSAATSASVVAKVRAKLNARSAFSRDVAVMLIGTVLGQATSVVLSPLLTRLYTPGEFGVLSVYTAALTILVVLAAMRYELTIPMVLNDADAINLAALCVSVLLAATSVVAVVAFAMPETTLQHLSLGGIAGHRYLLPLGFAALGFFYIGLYAATRAHAFADIARNRVWQGVLGPTSQIAMGLLGLGAQGLALGYVIGQSAGAAGLMRSTFRAAGASIDEISVQRMWQLALRYHRFPLIGSWAALIDAAGGQALYIMASAEYSVTIAGFLFLSERIVSRPLMMISNSVLQVFVAEAGQTAVTNPAQLKRRFEQVVKRQLVIALALVAIANIGAAALFPIVFGEEWTGAVVYLQALSIAYLAQALVQPVFHTLQILERQSLAAMWQAGRLVAVVTVFTVSGRMTLSAPTAILAYSLTQAACCVVLLALMAHAIRRIQK